MNDNNVSSGLGDATPDGYGSWLGGPVVEPQGWDDDGEGPEDSPLIEHPAVFYHGSGVMSEHLADFIDRLSERTMDRVLGVGRDQYQDENGQVFETLTVGQQYEELLDELADAIAYIAFIAIKAGVVVKKVVDRD